jgi:hypothetical protein
VAGPVEQLHQIHAQGLAEMQQLEADGVNETSLMVLADIAAKMEAALVELCAGAAVLYALVGGQPVGMLPGDGGAVQQQHTTSDVLEHDRGKGGTGATPLELLLLTEALVAAHDADVASKAVVLADLAYSTPSEVLLSYRLWWKAWTALSTNQLLLSATDRLQEARAAGLQAILDRQLRQQLRPPSRSGTTPRSGGGGGGTPVGGRGSSSK